MPINNSNLPITHVLKYEDYPDAPQYFAQFLTSLNNFIDPTYQILNGGVGYQNLMVPKLFTKTITAPATGNVTFNLPNPLRINPSAVSLGSVYVQGQPSSHPTDASCIYWHLSQNVIYVDNIPNLTPATTYVVTLIIQ